MPECCSLFLTLSVHLSSHLSARLLGTMTGKFRLKSGENCATRSEEPDFGTRMGGSCKIIPKERSYSGKLRQFQNNNKSEIHNAAKLIFIMYKTKKA